MYAPTTTATAGAATHVSPAGRDVTLAERLASLNESQRQAVECIDGPLLCLAGAGSGKTRVLTTRIANLIQRHDVEPSRILAVTFTRKAAEEMRGRLAGLVGEEAAAEVTLGTFHAIAASVLREYGSLIGLSNRFTIADDSDVLTRVRAVLRKHDIPRGDPDYRPGDVADRLAAAKVYLTQHLATTDCDEDQSRIEIYRAGDTRLFEKAVAEGELDEWDVKLFTRLYADYQQSLLGDDVLDFQDLLSSVLLLLRDRPQVLRIYQDRWLYISVDEYQDTDAIQELLLSSLASLHRNLMAVGDDDQAIYSFRKAEVENIRTFEHRYAPCTVVRLEDNYRSTPNILAVANAVISEQTDRPYDKTLRANLPEGPAVRVWSCASQEAEAEAIVAECQRLLASGQIRSLDEVMVLYRINSIAGAVERTLRRAQTPYRLVGGVRFHDRKEVRDLTAYLKLALNWSDTASFERVVNEPTRGVGPATMEKVLQEARVRGMDPISICSEIDSYTSLRPAQKKALGSFAEIIRFVGQVDRENGSAPAIHALLERTGYRTNLIDAIAEAEELDDVDAFEDASERLRIISEFVLFVEEFNRAFLHIHNRPARIIDLTTALTLSAADQEAAPLANESGEDRGAINLMSIHAAKGLEAPVVFVIGLEDGVLPITPRPGEMETTENMEEEGRLFYVAITRAQHRLILSAARTRQLRGEDPRPLPRSRFLSRLPETGYVIENKS